MRSSAITRAASLPVERRRNALATAVTTTMTIAAIETATITFQSFGVMPSSMPTWPRNGPACSPIASMTTKRNENHTIPRCAFSICVSVMPCSVI